jgi:hypothetical protein
MSDWGEPDACATGEAWRASPPGRPASRFAAPKAGTIYTSPVGFALRWRRSSAAFAASVRRLLTPLPVTTSLFRDHPGPLQRTLYFAENS